MKPQKNPFIIKICGIVHPEDASISAHMGASHIGVILTKKSKKWVPLILAKEIVQAAFEANSIPVGVFNDEHPDEVLYAVKQLGLTAVQLHHPRTLCCLHSLLPRVNATIAIPLNSKSQPKYKTHLKVLSSEKFTNAQVLYDHHTPGSGIAFNHHHFKPLSKHFWILAGGLTPTSVGSAVKQLKPNGVDVSTGVQDCNSKNGLRKDPTLIRTFIQEALYANRQN